VPNLFVRRDSRGQIIENKNTSGKAKGMQYVAAYVAM